MNPIKLKNLTEGDLGEESVLPILESYFNTNLKKTHKHFQMDFIDEEGVYYEVKTRNNNYKKYPTTMVGFNKIEFCNNLNKSSYFVFKFTDGVYYYEYDKTKINELEIKRGGRCDRGKYEYKSYAYIPITLLTKIVLLEKELTEKIICLPQIPPHNAGALRNDDIKIYKYGKLVVTQVPLGEDEKIIIGEICELVL